MYLLYLLYLLVHEYSFASILIVVFFYLLLVVFIAEDMTTPNVKEGMQAAGMNSILPKEHGAKFFTLPFVKNFEKDVSASNSFLS